MKCGGAAMVLCREGWGGEAVPSTRWELWYPAGDGLLDAAVGPSR